MNDIAIRVENLSKRYRIGQRERYYTLRDTLARSLGAPFRWLKEISNFESRISNLADPQSTLVNPPSAIRHPPSALGDSQSEIRNSQSELANSQFAIRNSQSVFIWALKDVSFEVKRGEVVGIIGRNGAGKSTLLKILSRITKPTEGEAEVFGRVGSLLEVGTGFHPELTGRENIYLNGAILGMRKLEIDRKFDEIVAFAEVERFIDTPLKHYSSGMFMRLAFSVAAHLDPEILLVDEVLAVGDLHFQRKCFDKIEGTRRDGRTVIFVSHNLQAVERLCSQAFLLESGRLLEDGPTALVLGAYISKLGTLHQPDVDLSMSPLRSARSDPGSPFKWTRAKLLNSAGDVSKEIRFGEPFELLLEGVAATDCTVDCLGFSIINKVAGRIFNSHPTYNSRLRVLKKGRIEFRAQVNPNILAPAHYEIHIGAIGPHVADFVDACIEFIVVDLGITPDKRWGDSYKAGVVDCPWCQWIVNDAPVV